MNLDELDKQMKSLEIEENDIQSTTTAKDLKLMDFVKNQIYLSSLKEENKSLKEKVKKNEQENLLLKNKIKKIKDLVNGDEETSSDEEPSSDEETEEIEEQDGLKRSETDPNPVDVANVYP